MNNEYVNSFPFDPTEFPFNIEASGISHLDSSHVINREKSYCYILEFICEGSGILICDGREYHLSRGDAYLLPKGSEHTYYANKSWKKIWFNFDGTLVSNLLVAYGLERTVVFKGFNDLKIIEELYEITQMDMPVQDILLAASLQFHKILQKFYTNVQKPQLSRNVNAIKKLLDANLYKKNISLKEIANELCMSQTQVIEIFKRVFNMTPYQYFAKKRIEIAASLLLNSNMQIKEIAELLNYSDQPYFSNAFKKIMGVSPEKYRKINTDTNLDKSNLHNKISLENLENLPFDLKINRR